MKPFQAGHKQVGQSLSEKSRNCVVTVQRLENINLTVKQHPSSQKHTTNCSMDRCKASEDSTEHAGTKLLPVLIRGAFNTSLRLFANSACELDFTLYTCCAKIQQGACSNAIQIPFSAAHDFDAFCAWARPFGQGQRWKPPQTTLPHYTIRRLLDSPAYTGVSS